VQLPGEDDVNSTSNNINSDSVDTLMVRLCGTTTPRLCQQQTTSIGWYHQHCGPGVRSYVYMICSACWAIIASTTIKWF